jgi:myo-inositol-1(or 4)-monophosphatase
MGINKITIDFLKKIALEVYENVSPLIGTEEGAKKLERGAGGDISMEIDTVAENTVIEILENHGIDILLLSEEIGEKYIGDTSLIETTERKLIVDPIDGSTNSSRGIPFYSVSIAYAEGNTLEDIKFAVILDLSTKDLYWAEKEKGAFYNDHTIKTSKRGLDDQLIFEIDFYLWNLRKKLKDYRSIFQKLYRIRVMGSIALSLCQVAKGALDGYLDFRKGIRLVDMAAGYLIVKEAGGAIFTVKGEPLTHDLSMELLLPLVVCNSNSELKTFLIKELEKLHE